MSAALALIATTLPLHGQPDASAPSSAASDAGAAEADEAERQAVDLYERSREAYRRGDFAEAVKLLEQAYALRPDAVLIFNLARAYEAQGDLARAVHNYERYLELDPNVQDRGAIERRLSNLRNQMRERERLRRERDQAAERARRAQAQKPAPAAPPSRPWPYILGGAGLATIGLGLVLGAVAKSDQRNAEDESQQVRAREFLDRARTRATWANVSFAVGGAMVLGSGVWIWLDSSRPPQAGRTAAARAR